MHVFLSVEKESRGEGGVCTCTDPTKEYVGNACVPKCGEGADERRRRCMYLVPEPYKRVRLGNACVPKCGDGAD